VIPNGLTPLTANVDSFISDEHTASSKNLSAGYIGRLKFLGRQVSNRNLYTPYKVTLITSKYEGEPMSALESLACGIPCVALPIPALRELFEQDASYFLAHDETPKALAVAVLNLV